MTPTILLHMYYSYLAAAALLGAVYVWIEYDRRREIKKERKRSQRKARVRAYEELEGK